MVMISVCFTIFRFQFAFHKFEFYGLSVFGYGKPGWPILIKALLSIGSLSAFGPYFKAASSWDGVLPLSADMAPELSTSPA